MRLLTFLTVFLFVFGACGNGNQQNQEQENSMDTMTEENMEATESNSDVRTIDIYGINKMKFVVEEDGEMIGTAESIEASDGNTYLLLEGIQASPGEELRIRLTTISEMPAAAMAHNWVLLNAEASANDFAMAASQARDNDYLPEDRMNEVLEYTEMAGGGETVEVTFTAPEEAGDYPYLCTFPGHFGAGMKGLLKVQ